MPRLVRFMLVALVACAVVGAAGGAPAPVQFALFVQTELPLGGIARTPSGWVYTSENTGRFRTSDARGRGLKDLAQIDQGGEEVRCEASPGGAGFVKGAVYCHFPDDRIVRMSANGRLDVVATLPHVVAADGAMAFDTGGLFARGAIVAATGGSVERRRRLRRPRQRTCVRRNCRPAPPVRQHRRRRNRADRRLLDDQEHSRRLPRHATTDEPGTDPWNLESAVYVR